MNDFRHPSNDEESTDSFVPPIDVPDQADVLPLLDSVVGNIIRLAGSDAGLVSIWDADRRRLRATASYGLEPTERHEIELALDQALPNLIQDETAVQAISSAHSANLPGIGPLPARRLITVPLRSHGRLVGLLCLFEPDGHVALPSGEHDGSRPVLDILSGHLDVILQNARLLRGIIDEKRWLEAVIRHTGEGILILDSQGRVLGGNPAFRRLTGLADVAIRGRTFPELFDAQAGVMASGDQLVEVWLRGDRRRVFEANRAIITDDDGEPVGGVVSLRDVTSRREAAELQSTFFSVISHELKTPIAVIKGYADLISDDLEATDKTQLRRQLGVIRDESERLSRMVENLLEASRIQSGALELRIEQLAIGKLVEKVVRRLGTVSEKHEIEARMPARLPVVLADPERIEEVMTNLVDNAIKYSPNGGRIDISVAVRADDVVVTVADEGTGVSDADRDRIFERFSRLDSRVVRKAKGAGLGLFICRAIVEAHGGRIWVDASPAGGASFAFSVPRERPAELPALIGFSANAHRPDSAT